MYLDCPAELGAQLQAHYRDTVTGRFDAQIMGERIYEKPFEIVVTKDLPARRLLTTFPIIEQDPNRVVIDFNRGMRRLYTEFWAAYGRNYYSRHDFEEVETDGANALMADQGFTVIGPVRQCAGQDANVGRANPEQPQNRPDTPP